MALWRVEKAADYLGIRPKTLYEWVRLGRVPYRKLGFNVRFDPEELESWVSAQSSGAGTKPSAPAADSGDGASAMVPAAAAAPPGAAVDPDALSQLRELATEAAKQLRRVEADVGAELSFPQRQALRRLAERLVSAVGSGS